MQLSCSIQFPKGCSRAIFTSEKRSGKLCHVSHHDLGGICWLDHWILDSIGSRIPSYDAWVILLPSNGVMSGG
jgi:hypothetical protein